MLKTKFIQRARKIGATEFRTLDVQGHRVFEARKCEKQWTRRDGRYVVKGTRKIVVGSLYLDEGQVYWRHHQTFQGMSKADKRAGYRYLMQEAQS
jgi:hypothetical protein